jgi:TIR domain
MRVFLSHASEDRDAAEQIYLVLVKAGHDVFFDRSELPAGGDYNTRIQEAVYECELFIFLISPNSVARSSYALTELKFAREKRQHPEGYVLPVMVRETSYDLIPNYLKAVSILEPEGNTAAEVGRQVEVWPQPRNRKLYALVVALVLLLSVLGGVAGYHYYFSKKDSSEKTEQPSLAGLNPAFVRFRGSLNREAIIEPLRDYLKNQGINTPRAVRDDTLTQTSIEYYDANQREEANRLGQLVEQYLGDKGYSFQFNVVYSPTPSSSYTGAKVVVSIYLR